MLSVAKIRHVNKSAFDYYAADDYYSQNSGVENLSSKENIDPGSKSRVPSFWYGKLTKDFNLQGEVTRQISNDLQNGILPNGVLMQGKLNSNQEEIHDSGRDLVFSAPKSVSILSEVLEVEPLRKLHNLAVKKTLDHIEENYSYTRVKIKGQIVKQLTKNLLFSGYVHNTSRELDPQLHTHCVAFNVTKRADGNYRTVLFDPIFDNYKQLGLIYRSNLAFELQKSGFTIEVTDPAQGLFEIKGLPQEIIDTFSSRRKQIEDKIKELGINSAKSKEIAAIITRDKKIDVADHLLKQDWNETLKEVLQKLVVKIEANPSNKDFDKVFRTSLKKNWKQNLKDNFSDIIEEKLLPLLKIKPQISSKPAHFAKEAVNSAINSLSERNSIFTEKNLLQSALKNGLGKTDFEYINQEIQRCKEREALIICSSLGLNNHLATKESLNTELKIIEFTKESLKPENYLAPIYDNVEAKQLSNPGSFSNLIKSQQRACHFILTSPQRVIAIQGYAGTGKTHMLETTAQLLANKNFEIFGLAPTGTAVKELEKVGINSKTLQWFLGKYDGVANGRGTIEGRQLIRQEFKNKIVVVDEGSLISSNQMKNILTIQNELGFKLVLLGDTKQENAVEAGNPFYQIQKHGLKTVIMDDIIRQKNEKLRTSIYDTIKASDKGNIDKGYIKKAFENLDNVIEVKLDKKPPKDAKESDLEKIKQKIELIEKIAKTTANCYTALNKDERDKNLILAPSNETRAKINNYIRENLKQSRELSDKTEIRTILVNKSLDEEQKQQINTYQKGDIVRFNKSYKTNNIIQDKYYQVFAKDIKRGNIYLREEGANKELVWNPSKIAAARKGVVEVYHQEKKEFAVGEKINFTRGFLSKNIINSESAEIRNFTEKSVILKIDNQELEISKKDPILNHIDYGYGYTVHRAQGKTVDNVIAVLESYRPKLTTQKSFYVEISRARYNATLILDDKEKIISTLEKTTGEKISIVDLLNAKKLPSPRKYSSKQLKESSNKPPVKKEIYQINYLHSR